MFDSIIEFIVKYKLIFLFYLIIVIFLYIKRNHLDYQAKIIILYRMKFGLKFIEKISFKFRQWVILFGYVGVGAGYMGLLIISFILIKNVIDYFTAETIVSSASIVYPGMTVPGMGVLQFWDWILAIFVIALVHEFSHGIVARAHNIKVKNTGIVFLGPIIGAFVEPDEKKMSRDKDIVQYSVLAAGSFANIILAVVALLLLNFAFIPIGEMMNEPTGFTFGSYLDKDLPAEVAGIEPGTLITGVNGKKVANIRQFSEKMFCTSPDENISINTANKNYLLRLTSNPDNSDKSFLGIKDFKDEFQLKEKYQPVPWKILYYFTEWFSGFLRWLFLLSLGIGLFNLLPLPIVDGGRMMQVTLHKLRGKEKGERNYRQITLFFLLLLLLTLFYPWLSKLLGI